jgi:hypothetical protein
VPTTPADRAVGGVVFGREHVDGVLTAFQAALEKLRQNGRR